MSWLSWLILAVIVTAVVAVAGLQPAGTRPVARTRLMHMGRLVLVALVVLFAYAAFRAHAGT